MPRPSKWTEEAIINFIKEQKYHFLEFVEYNKAKSIVKVWCGNPNHKPYNVIFDNFKGNKNKKGTRCNQCKIDNDTEWTEEKIISFVQSQNYTFVRFINFNKYASRLEVICPNGHQHKIYFSNFYVGRRCRKCYITWNEQNIIDFVENENYKFIRFKRFDGYASIIEIECEKGHLTTMVFRKFREGCRCSTCNESKGERKISKILNELNIMFEKQYKFDDCKCKNSLLFDFYLPQYNICIEFDGIQHYEILPHWGGIDKLIETKIHDVIKTNYCKINNIKLIRIPYWKINNIKNILCQELILN